MISLLDDLRLALRALRSRPGLSVLIVLTMATGIGVTVGAYAYLAYFAWPTMEAPDSDRLVFLRNPNETSPDFFDVHFSVKDWRELAEARAEVFEVDTMFRLYSASVQASDKSLHVFGAGVSGRYFELFGARPLHGRLLEERDDDPGAPPVLVLSHLTWQRHFGADPEVVGTTVQLEGRYPYTIVGVAPPHFQGSGVWSALFTPLAQAGPLYSRTVALEDQTMPAIGRLHRGMGVERARERLAVAAQGLDEARPLEEPRNPTLEPVNAYDTAMSGEPIYLAAKVLVVAAVLLLCLACANVANLMLAHGVARRTETAMHAALGAGRLRMARRRLIESLLLSVTGGLLGLSLVQPLLRLIENYLRKELPVSMGDWSAGTRLTVDDGTLALVVTAISVSTGVLFGMAPLVQTLRLDLVAALKSAGTGGSGRRWQMRDVLLVTQVALSVMLLVAAALLGRTLWQLQRADLGFEPQGLYVSTVYLPKERLNEPQDGIRLFEELAQRVADLPEVSSASLAWRVPLSLTSGEQTFEVDGDPKSARWNAVGPDYFDVLGVPLVAGRGFDRRDNEDTPLVAVVNRTGAEILFPGESPIGQTLVVREKSFDVNPEVAEAIRIVGVVADSRFRPPSEEIGAQVYVPFAQRPASRPSLLIRSSGGAVARPMRDLLRAEYPDLAVVSLVPFREQLRRSHAMQTMNAELSGGLSILGLLLAGLGIFSLMSYAVTQRTREIGIRMAIGADRGDVQRWVLGHALRRIALGLAIGVAGALALAQLLRSLLLGVGPTDPFALLVVPLVLGIVALFAAWLPTRRAMAVEPVRALRQS